MSEPTTGGAGCALHPEAPARSVCDRCGAYMCDACSEGGARRLCAACRARTDARAFPLRRDAWSLTGLFGIAWQAFTRGGVQLVLGFVIVGVVYVALSFVPQLVLPAGVVRNRYVFAGILVAWILVDLTLVTVLGLGLVDMAFDALDGQRVRVETLFWHVGKAGRLVGLLLLILGAYLLPTLAFEELATLAVFVGTRLLGAHARLALVLPAAGGLLALAGSTWLLLGLAFAQLELALDDDVGAVEAMRRGLALARGKRWAILGVGLLAGLVGSAGMLLCGVGLLASLPFAALVMSGLFLTLRNGSGLPEPVRRGRRARREEVAVPLAPPATG